MYHLLELQEINDPLENVGIAYTFARVIETRGVNQHNGVIANGIFIDGDVYFIGLGFLSVTDANILVASERVDELKNLYSAICSLNGFTMHSLMIFLIISSGLDQFWSLFDRSLNTTCPSTTHNAAKCYN
jgi:hypothetical protein